MSIVPFPEPSLHGDYWLWRASHGPMEVRFVGRGSGHASRRGVLEGIERDPPPPAWLRQIHSAEVRTAREGDCGEGDALVTAEGGLALSVATADCVPLLIGGARRIAAVHAGWRGIAAGIVPNALAALGEPPGALTAWIGPAIGACCYEVGEDVAATIAVAAGRRAIRAEREARPRADLAGAVAAQLDRAGVIDVRLAWVCTRCRPDRLWSHRGQGPGAGRNLAFIWLRRPSSPV